MSSTTPINAPSEPDIYTKSTPGRGYVVVVYGLYIGSIMAGVTAPLGVLIAHLRLGRGAAWLDTHLRFQIRTFWLGILAAVVALLLWQAAGRMAIEPLYAWTFGYLFFTVAIIWLIARCAVGINRLISNRPIDAPRSWLFGLSKQR